jgi:hypothetical protein
MYTYVYVYTYISRVLGNPSVSPEIWESVGESSMSSSSSNLSFFIRWTIPLHSYLHDHDVWEKTTMSQNRPVRSQVSGPGLPDLRPDLCFSGRPDPRPYLSGVFLRPHSLTVDCVFFFLPSKKTSHEWIHRQILRIHVCKPSKAEAYPISLGCSPSSFLIWSCPSDIQTLSLDSQRYKSPAVLPNFWSLQELGLSH